MINELPKKLGSVTQFLGLVIESSGPEVFLGEHCKIISSKVNNIEISAEVVGIRNGKVLLMPYGEIRGVCLGSEVIATGKPVEIGVGDELLGRVINAFGEPLDNHGKIRTTNTYPLYPDPINPLSRPRICEILETGIKAIDTLLTIGKGQRVGIFAGSGVGKSTLLGMIARYMSADVNVIALIGERGREVLDFIEDNLGEEGLKRSVVVVATSDEPALVRAHAVHTATAIAEYYRDKGLDVVLTMDSITRYAMAQREIGLSIGEPPTTKGYTPSVFAMLPKLLERGGTAISGGSITAFYTVLNEADDINDPISDSVRSILDGNIVLSRSLSNKGQYPAIDLLSSTSRLMNQLLDMDNKYLANKIIKIINYYNESIDMIKIGAYKKGHSQELDQTIEIIPVLEKFLHQSIDEKITRNESISLLTNILSNTGINHAT